MNSRGDTIVEVLMAIAIVSSVLMAGFLSTSKSLGSSRLAQERTEALKLAEAQTERLRSLADSTTVDIFDTAGGTVSCIDETPARHGFGLSSVPDLNSDNMTYPAACKDINGLYAVSVHYQPGSSNLFTVRVRWSGPTGTKQEVPLLYRLYEPAPPPAPAPPLPAASCILNPATINVPEVFPGGASISQSHIYYSAQLQYLHDISGATAGLTSNCRFRVLVTTRDPEHPLTGDQPNERLYVRFHLEGGGTVDTSLTQDLPRNSTSIETDVGTYTFPRRPITAEFRHYFYITGDRSSPNSVDPQAIEFIAL